EHRTLERFGDQRLSILTEEVLQQCHGPVARRFLQKVPGLGPQQRVQAIPPVLVAVRPDADEDRFVQAIPQMLRIGVICRLTGPWFVGADWHTWQSQEADGQYRTRKAARMRLRFV